MSWFDKLLAIGSAFDYITPAVAVVQDVTNGAHHTLLIPENCGRSGRSIERMLDRAGIDTWGAMVVNRRILLTVRAGDVGLAHRVLDRAGVPWEA